MEICLDVQPAIAQRAGVGRYTQFLAQHLDRLAQPHRLNLFFFDFHGRGLPFPVSRARVRRIRWCPGRIVQRAWRAVGWPPFDAFAGRADLYHFPNFIVPPLRRGQSVVTIHDMSFLRHPEFAETRNQQYLATRIRETARRADHIITDSRFSADEIREFLGVAPERITAIHLGIGTEFARPPDATVADARRRLGLDRPYLLFVGTIEPRKNVPFLVDVFETLTDFDGDLVLAGGLGWKVEPILERIRRSPRADAIRLLQGVNDADLPALYAGAELFLIASHYEGFGFPPLEAMACGTPVLASPGGSLAEVLGDAAAILPPTDAAAWATAAQRLLHDTAARTAAVAAGRDHAATFTWEATARRTLAVYEAVAGGAP